MPAQQKIQKENEERHCLFCEKPIPKNSRPEKVYCNVDCKNNYNSRKKAALKAKGSAHQVEILKIIKNNYQILLQYRDGDQSLKHSRVTRQELIDKGFNPAFFTSIFEDQENQLWKCCFDISYVEEGAQHFKLRYMPFEQFIDEDTQEQVIVQRIH